MYKYLGMELDTQLSQRDFKERIAEKARRNVSRVWYMGMRYGGLSVRAGINVYKALVRSVLADFFFSKSIAKIRSIAN